MGWRYYDPTTGRFLTKDPIGYAGGVNLYAYCANNPVNFMDPLGLKSGFFGYGARGQFFIYSAQVNINLVFDKPADGPFQLGIQVVVQSFGGALGPVAKPGSITSPNPMESLMGGQRGVQFGGSLNPRPQVPGGELFSQGEVSSAGGWLSSKGKGGSIQASWDPAYHFDPKTASWTFSYGQGTGQGVFATHGTTFTINVSEIGNRLADKIPWLTGDEFNEPKCSSHPTNDE